MMRRTLLALVTALALLPCGTALAQQSSKLVLQGGTEVPVASATVKGDLVYATFPDGHMQAYAVDDVDLAASGLAPQEKAPARPQEAARPRGLKAAQASPITGSGLAITDADVTHTRESTASSDEGGEEKKDESPNVSFLIQGMQTKTVGGSCMVTGTLVNNGDQSVQGTRLEGVAVNDKSQIVGQGATTIAEELAPQASVGFSMSFPVSGPVSDVRVRASAAVAGFEFKPLEPPSSQSGAEQTDSAQAGAGSKPAPKTAAQNKKPPEQQRQSPMQWAPQGSGNEWAPAAPVGSGGGSGR